MQKQILVGMFALAFASIAFAGTPATPTPAHTQTPQTHKDQVFFQGKWRHVREWHEVSAPLTPNETVAQVEKFAKEISADRAGDQPPRLYQIHGKDWLIWDDPLWDNPYNHHH